MVTRTQTLSKPSVINSHQRPGFWALTVQYLALAALTSAATWRSYPALRRAQYSVILSKKLQIRPVPTKTRFPTHAPPWTKLPRRLAPAMLYYALHMNTHTKRKKLITLGNSNKQRQVYVHQVRWDQLFNRGECQPFENSTGNGNSVCSPNLCAFEPPAQPIQISRVQKYLAPQTLPIALQSHSLQQFGSCRCDDQASCAASY